MLLPFFLLVAYSLYKGQTGGGDTDCDDPTDCGMRP